MPKRIQMTRNQPWRHMHPDAVIVDRRTPWGNSFVIGEPGVPDAARAVGLFRAAVMITSYAEECVTQDPSMVLHSIMSGMPGPVPRLEAIRLHLRGRDLACWCPLDRPCHADVLLELANQPLRSVRED